MESHPESMIPGTAPKRFHYQRYVQPAALILGLLLVIGLIYSVFRYTPVGSSIAEAWGIASMPPELQHALFLADKDGITTIYRVSGVTLVPTVAPGTVISAAKSEHALALIVRDVSGTYRILVDDREVYATSTPLKGIGLSPDDTDVVLSARTDPKEVPPAPVYLAAVVLHPAAWDVYLLHAKQQGVMAHLGAGTAPVFVDARHVAWVSPVGIASVDLERGVQTIMERRGFESYPAAILNSPNRLSLGIIDASAKSFEIYRLNPGTIEKTAAFSYTGSATSYALGDSALYTLRNNGTRTQIVKQEFASPRQSVAGTIPQRYHIGRVLVGSL